MRNRLLSYEHHRLGDGVQFGIDTVGAAGENARRCCSDEHTSLTDTVREL